MKTEPPVLLAHLTPDCHPIATKSRKYSQSDRNFIRDKVQRLAELKSSGLVIPHGELKFW